MFLSTPPTAEILCVKNGRAIVVCGFLMKSLKNMYKGFLPYATFGTCRKTALAKNRISKTSILCTQ